MVEVLRVLMIEDQPGDARKVKELLDEAELAGRLPALQIRMEQVDQFAAGIERLEQGGIDTLLLSLSGPDDLHMLAEVRQKFSLIPVVVCVNPGNESLALLALTQGASDYLFTGVVDIRRTASVFRHAMAYVVSTANQRRLDWIEGNISEVVWHAQPDLRFSAITGSITRLTGFSVEEGLHTSLLDWIVPDSRQTLQEVIGLLGTFETSALSAWSVSLELEHLRKDNTPLWVEMTLHATVNPAGQFAGLIGVTRDISTRHAIQEKLDYLSMHDPLTGLFNRAYFVEEIKRLEPSRMYPITIVMADLEGLKTVNFQHGMAAGDELIKQAANLLRAAFRAEDLVARIGGDEFMAIMPRCNPRAAGRALQRVVNMVKAFNEEADLPLSLSLGIATAEQGQSLMDTIKFASPQKNNSQITD
jgi:diguanylate cyclase (GGDEF)-like protein/PAS domain S-box-containing protein